jgi:hypothetical protein
MASGHSVHSGMMMSVELSKSSFVSTSRRIDELSFTGFEFFGVWTR